MHRNDILMACSYLLGRLVVIKIHFGDTIGMTPLIKIHFGYTIGMTPSWHARTCLAALS